MIRWQCDTCDTILSFNDDCLKDVERRIPKRICPICEGDMIEMSKAPTKLLVVENETLAAYMQKKLGEDWMVVGFGHALCGHLFDFILVSREGEKVCEQAGGIVACYIDHLYCKLNGGSKNKSNLMFI